MDRHVTKQTSNMRGNKVKLMTFEEEVRERTIAEVTARITEEVTAKTILNLPAPL